MRFALAALLVVLIASCRSNVVPDGPRLVSEVTLPPLTPLPSREAPATETTTPSPETRTAPAATDALPPATTVPNILFAVTPTEAPTKTPTITPTITPTAVPSVTPLPAIPTATDEPVRAPTLAPDTPVPAQVAQAPDVAQATSSGALSLPLPGVPDVPAAPCTYPWFFTSPRLPDCPLAPWTDSQASFIGLQRGFMMWVGAQDAIYVLYDTADLPRWQVFPDRFEDGMPETDGGLVGQEPDYGEWQPRRGFGLIWRQQPGVKDRIGWSEDPWENQFTTRVQTRSDGTIFLQHPDGLTFALTPDSDWRLYR